MSSVTPRLTVGMPVYNGARYLAGAIESILAQSMADFELIIADNASTDATAQICREYASQDARIRVIRNGRNIGAAGNFNLVRDLARAPLLKWAAYDDRCAPELLEKCVTALALDSEAVLAYARTIMIDDADQPIGPYADALNLPQPDPIARYRRYHHRYRRMGLVNVLYGVIRTNALRKTPGIAPYANSDIVLIGELALQGKFIEIPEALFLRRDHAMMTVRAFPSVQHRAEYLDPGRQRAARHPYLRMAVEHLHAVERTPLRWTQRVAAAALVAQFVAWHGAEFLSDRLSKRQLASSTKPDAASASRLQ